MTIRQCLAALLSGLLGISTALLPAAAGAQTSVTGQWTRLNDLPFGPIHEQLLPDGRVLLWGRDAGSPPRIFDPVTQALSTPPSPGYDQFCSGHAYLADQRILVAGGHVRDLVGLPQASVYDTATNDWTAAPDMNAGRWYPTVTTLPNGDALVVSGQIDTTVGVNTLPQIYQAATNSWRDLTSAQLGQDLYPMMFLAPNGKVLNVAPTVTTRYLDTSGTGGWTVLGDRVYGYRDYGSAAMYEAGKILVVGGGDPPNGTAEIIDLNAAAPAWRFTGYMTWERRQLNTTLLPDGTILATGGSYGQGFNNTTAPVYMAELWDPATGLWSQLASASTGRFYHSSALLLPDARVLSVGGDDNPAVEIFSPPYLFKGARPSMSAVPATINYGQSFPVQSPDAASISKVTLIRMANVTHAFNQNTRLNVLQFTPASGALNITPPANANLAPPGLYMLFIVNGSGVPSVASLVKLTAGSPTVTPPALSSLSPNSATAGGAAFTLTVNGSNFASGATVNWNGAARTTSFVGAGQVTAAIPASDIAAAGTAQVTAVNPGSSASNALTFTINNPAPPPVQTYTLAVSRIGSAATRGTITSSPAGVNCGSVCSAPFNTGTVVTLTVRTNGNGVFAGWSGACSGSATCTVMMDADRNVTATINRR